MCNMWKGFFGQSFCRYFWGMKCPQKQLQMEAAARRPCLATLLDHDIFCLLFRCGDVYLKFDIVSDFSFISRVRKNEFNYTKSAATITKLYNMSEILGSLQYVIDVIWYDHPPLV